MSEDGAAGSGGDGSNAGGTGGGEPQGAPTGGQAGSSGQGKPETGGASPESAWESIASEYGDPDKVRKALEHARTWEQRAKENRAGAQQARWRSGTSGTSSVPARPLSLN